MFQHFHAVLQLLKSFFRCDLTANHYKNSIAYPRKKSEAGFSDLAVIVFRYAQINQIYR